VGQSGGGRAGRLRGRPDGRARPGDPALRHGDRPGHHPRLAGAGLVAIVAGFFLIVAGLVVGAGSLVARFRRAQGVERQQLRWLALAAG
jgi:hypothetical protein